MKEKNVEVLIHGIKCDYCDWKDMIIQCMLINLVLIVDIIY